MWKEEQAVQPIVLYTTKQKIEILCNISITNKIRMSKLTDYSYVDAAASAAAASSPFLTAAANAPAPPNPRRSFAI